MWYGFGGGGIGGGLGGLWGIGVVIGIEDFGGWGALGMGL